MYQTKQELAQQVLGHTNFDCTLPQPWLEDVVAKTGCKYREVLGGTVWSYGEDAGGVFGCPMAITSEAAFALAIYMEVVK